MVAGLVLAAGAGRRYGGPKALVRHGGRLLVEVAVDALRGGGCSPVVVVLGASADEVAAAASLGNATIVVNPGWARGMGSSLRVGLAAVAATATEAVVVGLVDTPGINADAVLRIAGHAGRDALVVATYHGRRGHPVLLGRDHWAGVGGLAEGDVGARPYLAAHLAETRLVPCEDIADGDDLDLPPV